VSSEGKRRLQPIMNGDTLTAHMRRESRIYLDVCCLNRPFDDQRQERIHFEAEAVETIMLHAQRGDWRWIGSEAMMYEIANLTDFERRGRLLELLEGVREWVRTEDVQTPRLEALMALGFKPLDALHVASGETAEVEVILTTDDRMLRTAHRWAGELRVRVVNPLRWLEEQIR
jgi:hypothetical protein